MRPFVLALFFGLAIASTASAQSRRAAPVEAVGPEAGEGSGGAVQERAYDPRANTEVQPERSEGNEDDLDLNEGDDGNNGTGGN